MWCIVTDGTFHELILLTSQDTDSGKRRKFNHKDVNVLL